MITDVRELLVAVDEIFDNGMNIIINDHYITLVNRVEDNKIDIEQAKEFQNKWGTKGWFTNYNGRKAIRFYLLGDKLCDQ